MLLLDADCDTGPLVQGFVRSLWPTGQPLGAAGTQNWAQHSASNAELWSELGALSVAIRITATPNGRLETVHSFLVPKAAEKKVRLVCAAFLRADRTVGAKTEVPHCESDLAGAYIHPGETRIALRYEALQTREGIGIPYDVRLFDHLPRILRTAAGLGLPVSYEAQITPWDPPRELLRSALYDAARLQDMPSMPPDLGAAQSHLSTRLKRAARSQAYHLEECLATPAEADAGGLSHAVSKALSDSVYWPAGSMPALQNLKSGLDDAFAYHVHTHVMFGPPSSPETEPVAAWCSKTQ